MVTPTELKKSLTSIRSRFLQFVAVLFLLFSYSPTLYSNQDQRKNDLVEGNSCQQALGSDASVSISGSSSNSSRNLEEQIRNSKPYGPRGFVVGINIKNAEEKADSVDAGLGAGYFEWVQSAYIVSKSKILSRMAADKLAGIDRKESFFGEYEVRSKIIAQIKENSGRLNTTTAPFIMVSDLTQDDLKRVYERAKNKSDEESAIESTHLFKQELANSKLYAANFISNSEFQLEEVPSEVKDRFIEVGIFHNQDETENGKGGYFFMQASWNDGSHGAIQFKHWAYSKFIQTMRSLRRKVVAQGYTVEMNQTNLDEFNYVMSRCASMPRKDGPNFDSRFSDVETEAWRILFKRGRAYYSVLRSPQGEILAGTFGYINRDKGMIQGESVFYPVSARVKIYPNGKGLEESQLSKINPVVKTLVWSAQHYRFLKSSDFENLSDKTLEEVAKEISKNLNHTDLRLSVEKFEDITTFASSAGEKDVVKVDFLGGQIDLARIVLGTVGERTYKAGVPFIDAGMVTEFTASLKGIPLPNAKWKSLVAVAHSRGLADIDLSSHYKLDEEKDILGSIEEEFLADEMEKIVKRAQELSVIAKTQLEFLNLEEQKNVTLYLKQIENTLKKYRANKEVPNMDMYKQLASMVEKLEVIFP